MGYSTEGNAGGLASFSASDAGGERTAHGHGWKTDEILAEDAAAELGVEVERARAGDRVEPSLEAERDDVYADARGQREAENLRRAAAHGGPLEGGDVEDEVDRAGVGGVGVADHAQGGRAARVVVEVGPEGDAEGGARRGHGRQSHAMVFTSARTGRAGGVRGGGGRGRAGGGARGACATRRRRPEGERARARRRRHGECGVRRSRVARKKRATRYGDPGVMSHHPPIFRDDVGARRAVVRRRRCCSHSLKRCCAPS